MFNELKPYIILSRTIGYTNKMDSFILYLTWLRTGISNESLIYNAIQRMRLPLYLYWDDTCWKSRMIHIKLEDCDSDPYIIINRFDIHSSISSIWYSDHKKYWDYKNHMYMTTKLLKICYKSYVNYLKKTPTEMQSFSGDDNDRYSLRFSQLPARQLYDGKFKSVRTMLQNNGTLILYPHRDVQTQSINKIAYVVDPEKFAGLRSAISAADHTTPMSSNTIEAYIISNVSRVNNSKKQERTTKRYVILKKRNILLLQPYHKSIALAF
ncbi:hypothetical protein A3Q56_06689 [Intoshia linei]|uniref:Uncharacterized protein n=1 Tax=Intoshia linei TaxID=1819745 RepID=A0A177AUD8_9BILA|nr:hypothetical protein A3Q56_06689 [Intoshia linei]